MVASSTSSAGRCTRPLSARTTAIANSAAREYAAVLPELAEMGLAYKQALVVLDMALVLGPDDPVVQASVDDARAILERLGARAFSARLDELMGEAADSRSVATSAARAGGRGGDNGRASVAGTPPVAWGG